MGIAWDAGTSTATVTGYTWLLPCDMDTIDTDGTVGGNVSKGGYGNHVYTVSMNLVLGSEDDQTFFDLKDSIVEMASGYTLTIYTHALRGPETPGAWASRMFGNWTDVPEDSRKLVVTGILQLYTERRFQLDPNTGIWVDRRLVGTAEFPRIIAVTRDQNHQM